jgi:predicted amidophosphoribosyltransferase
MCNSTNWGVKPQQAPFTQAQPTIEASKYCSQCGEKIESTNPFCSYCGVKQS